MIAYELVVEAGIGAAASVTAGAASTLTAARLALIVNKLKKIGPLGDKVADLLRPNGPLAQKLGELFSQIKKGGRIENGVAPNRPLGARGPISDREFDPANAGGPIRQLTTDKIRITDRGIDYAERHLSRFGPDAANEGMVQRLRDIAAGKLKPTQADLNFYSHELRESIRYKRLGFLNGQPLDADAAYDLWNNAHTATLEDYLLKEGRGVLYHPSVIP